MNHLVQDSTIHVAAAVDIHTGERWILLWTDPHKQEAADTVLRWRAMTNLTDRQAKHLLDRVEG